MKGPFTSAPCSWICPLHSTVDKAFTSCVRSRRVTSIDVADIEDMTAGPTVVLLGKSDCLRTLWLTVVPVSVSRLMYTSPTIIPHGKVAGRAQEWFCFGFVLRRHVKRHTVWNAVTRDCHWLSHPFNFSQHSPSSSQSTTNGICLFCVIPGPDCPMAAIRAHDVSCLRDVESVRKEADFYCCYISDARQSVGSQ